MTLQQLIIMRGIVTGYDETDKLFYGRVPWRDGKDEYEKSPWDKSKEEAGLVRLFTELHSLFNTEIIDNQ